jgi:hypothetical protein
LQIINTIVWTQRCLLTLPFLYDISELEFYLCRSITMLPFVSNSVISNRFPSIWNSQNFTVACPFDKGTIADFEKFNRNHYTGKSHQAIIDLLNNFAPRYGKVYQQCKIMSIAENFGVPLILTDGPFPWDEPNDNFNEIGVRIERIGIVFRIDNFDTKYVNHEMIHAAQEYMLDRGLMTKPPETETETIGSGLFQLKSSWFGIKIPTSINSIFLRVRKEVQAYFLSNSGTIANSDFEFALRALSGDTSEGHKKVLTIKEFEKLKSVIEIIMATEKLGRKRKDSQILAKFIIDLLKFADIDEYINYINKNYKSLYKL